MRTSVFSTSPRPQRSPRRAWFAVAGVAAFASLWVSELVAPPGASADQRVVVLGFDGLDYELTRQMIAEGRLPNFERLASRGTFAPLGTSIPPQSPVAWSNFITGMDPGGHGIFDFIHRDPKTLFPYLSTSKAEGAEKSLKIGKYQFPLASGETILLRRGEAFWKKLEDEGIETTIIRMPANFPPSGTATRELSGMGTPDIVGNYGTFSFYTTDYADFSGRTLGGGKAYQVRVRENVVKASLYGPDNPFLIEKEKARRDFTVYLDPVEPIAKIVVGDEERILSEGEWTEWVPVELPLIPTQGIPVMCRFYLKQVRPEFMLYVTSLDIDPMKPAMPISTPPEYAAELAEAAGRFYTEGMPEDTKALTEGVLSVDEFLYQAELAGEEVTRQYKYVLDQFEKGFLFYYFGNQDQIAHMIWRTMDPGHPAYDEETWPQYAEVIPEIIEGLDEVVGLTLDRLDPEDLLIVMSDHGFASWRRAMNLNTWLWKEGYLAVKNPDLTNDPGIFYNVDWSRTKAYGMGLNGLYINMRGREKKGIVNPQDKRALLEEIGSKLVEAVDSETGLRAVTKAYIAEDAYLDRGYLDIGPDMIVGYAKEMRCSNESAMGQVPQEVYMNNTEDWGADHCMDHEAVPGVLFTSRPLRKPAPSLQNLAAAILAEFGVEGFPGDAEETLKSIGYISGTR